MIHLVGTERRLAKRWSYTKNPASRFLRRGTTQLAVLLSAALVVTLALFWTIALDTLEVQDELHAVGHLAILSSQQRDVQSALLSEAAGVHSYVATGQPRMLEKNQTGQHALAAIIALKNASRSVSPLLSLRLRATTDAEQRVQTLLFAEMAAVRSGHREHAFALERSQKFLIDAYRASERNFRSALVAPVIQAESESDRIIFQARFVGVIGVASIALTTYLIIVTLIDGWRVETMAESDMLTALPNRRVFEAKANEAIMRHTKEGFNFGVIYADVDDFKTINDMHGHKAGDIVLRTIAERISSCVRRQDVAARLGGDEFALLISGVATVAHVRTVADRIVAALKVPIAVDGTLLALSCSVGMSFCPDDGVDFAQLLAHADKRMFSEKRSGDRRAGSREAAPPSAAGPVAVPLQGTKA